MLHFYLSFKVCATRNFNSITNIQTLNRMSIWILKTVGRQLIKQTLVHIFFEQRFSFKKNREVNKKRGKTILSAIRLFL